MTKIDIAKKNCHGAHRFFSFMRNDLCDDCLLRGVCKQLSVVVPSQKAVGVADARLEWQNRVYDLNKPYRQLTDWFIDAIRDHRGLFRNERFEIIEAPSFLSLLNPGIDYWMRSTFSRRWQTVADVDRLRRESRPRWRIIATALNAVEAGEQPCGLN